MVDKKNKIALSHFEISLREDGIVEVYFKNNTELNLTVCKELSQAYDSLLEEKKYPLLHFSGDYVSVTNEAREYSVSERGLQYSKAEAYVFTTLGHRLIANFYIKINKPSVPTWFFKTKEAAVEWLQQYL